MRSIFRAMANRCPHCGRGAVFATWFGLHDKCPVCGAVYYRGEGAWIGPTAMGYGVGAVIGVGGGAILIWNHWYFEGAEIVLMIAALLGTLALYRFIKGAWVGMLHDWGYVYP
jgi:uncharacterized protein (DUF983 family)